MKEFLVYLTALLATSSAWINAPNCGIRPKYSPTNQAQLNDPLAKIVGGNLTIEGDHPWHVAVLRNGAYICGGTIIDQYTVVTASHCTSNAKLVKLGLIKLDYLSLFYF